MEISCSRGEELLREASHLPAATYNLAHTLLAHSPTGNVFVPVRAMQFLAIIDREEFVFIDSARKNEICIAWQNFRPQQRSALDEPVAYEAVYYHPDAQEAMQRLQAEFPRALQAMAGKEKTDGPARVITLEKRS